MTTKPTERHASPARAPDNLRQLVLFRTIAIAGQTVTVAFVNSVLHIALPLLPLAAGIGFLAVFNVATWLRLGIDRPVSDGELFGQILVDIAVFTALLYLAGGADNPFAYMYVLNLTIAATMLPGSYAWSIAAVTGACYLLLMLSSTPLLHAGGEPVEYRLLMAGTAISFVITVSLLAFFVLRITGALRMHERLLAQAREGELNSERIVQLGALAAGAAHELSTPLATMAVVVKELGTRCDCSQKPELLSDLRIVSDQIELCKGALSRLLASAGQTRMDGGGKVALDRFLEALVEDCRLMRPKTAVTWRCQGTQPAPEIVVEQTLRQAIMNLLNNAADASPDHVDVEGRWDDQEICIRIRDRGEGIAPEAADKLGRTFFTTKPAGQGSGVGLVLSRTIIGRLGGSVRLFNQPERGACTEVRLPLAPFLVLVRS